MSRAKSRYRLRNLVLLVSLWLVAGSALPFILSQYSLVVPGPADRAVAGPRDSLTIGWRRAIGSSKLIVLDGGTLSMAVSGPPGAGADEALKALNAGTAQLKLSGSEISIAPGARLDIRSDDESDPAPMLAALAALRFDELALSDVSLSVGLPGGRVERIERFNGSVVARKRGSLTLKGKGFWRGSPAEVDTVLDLTGGQRDAGHHPLRLSLKSALMTVAFDGHVAVPDDVQLAGTVDVTVANLHRLGGWLAAGWLDQPNLRNVRVQGALEWTSKSVGLGKATLAMDGNVAKGALSLDLSGPRPMLAGTLAAESLDLTSYVALKSPRTTERLVWTIAALSGWSWDFVLPVVQNVDADLRVSTGQGSIGSMKFGRAAAAISLKDGHLQADIAELEFGEGTGAAAISANLRSLNSEVAVRAKLTGIELASVAPAAMPGTALQGRGNVVVDLTGRGRSIEEIGPTLKGRIAVTMAGGGRIGLDLRGLEASAVKGPGYGWRDLIKSTTAVDTLDLKVLVEDGWLFCQRIMAAAGDRAWSLLGSVNPRLDQIDVIVSTGKVAHKSGVSAGDVQMALPERQIRLSGLLSTPVIRLAMPDDEDGSQAPSSSASSPN